MSKLTAWTSGVAFMAALAVAVLVDAHDWQTAAFLLVVSIVFALMSKQTVQP